VASVPIGEGEGAVEFDAGTQLAFSANGKGTVTIAHEESPENLTVVQTLKTQPGARAMALDATTHRIYVAGANLESASAGFPNTTQNTSKILVYGME
jgi:hypothetical protein